MEILLILLIHMMVFAGGELNILVYKGGVPAKLLLLLEYHYVLLMLGNKSLNRALRTTLCIS